MLTGRWRPRRRFQGHGSREAGVTAYRRKWTEWTQWTESTWWTCSIKRSATMRPLGPLCPLRPLRPLTPTRRYADTPLRILHGRYYLEPGDDIPERHRQAG